MKTRTVANGRTNASPVDLNDVVALVRVVEAGSFTGAAAALGLPKSAVSRRVARLEEASSVAITANGLLLGGGRSAGAGRGGARR